MAEAVLLARRKPSQVLHVLRTASSAKLFPSAQEICTWWGETPSLNQSQYRTQNEVIVLPFLLSPPGTGPCLRGKTKPLDRDHWHHRSKGSKTRRLAFSYTASFHAITDMHFPSAPPFVVMAVQLLPRSQMHWGLAYWFVLGRGQSRHR